MAEKEQAGVVVFFDIEPALEMLSAEQRGHLFTAIIRYGHYGTSPTFEDQLVKMAWSFVKPSIDRANEKYIRTREKKRIAGITSDFRRNYAPKHGIDPNDEEALHAYICQHLSTDADLVSGYEAGDVIESRDVNESGIQSESVDGGGGWGSGGRKNQDRTGYRPPSDEEFVAMRDAAIEKLAKHIP